MPRRWVVLAIVLIAAVGAGVVATPAMANSAGVAASVSDADNTLTSGEMYWTGETVYFDNATFPSGVNDKVRIYHVDDDGTVGTLASEITLDADGSKVIDTEIYTDGDGEYVIGRSKTELFAFDANGTAVSDDASVTEAKFTVLAQRLSAEFDDERVATDGSTSVSLTSRRARYDVEISSPDASDDEIEQIFGDTTVSVRDDALNADFGAADISPGDYTFTFDVVDTAASDDASITVEEAGAVSVDITAGNIEVDRGDVASIPVTVTGTDSAWVTIGNVEHDGVRSIVKVSDGNDDGTVTLEANTANLFDATAADSDKFWTAAESDAVTTVLHNNSYADPVPVGDNDARSYDIRAGSSWNGAEGQVGGATDRSVMRVFQENTAVSLPSVITVDRGGIASIPVNVTGTESAWVTVGDLDDDGVRAIVEVTDGNDDGTVTLEANTYNLFDASAADSDKFWTAAKSDSVGTVWHNNSFGKPVPVGDDDIRHYDIHVGTRWNEPSGTLDGETDQTVLRVEQRSTTSVEILTAPAALDVETNADVTEAIVANKLTPTQTIAEGDLAVAEIRATGIVGAYAAQDGDAVQKLISLNENVSGVDFTIQKPATTTTGTDETVDLAANSDALTVVTDQDHGQLFVVMDTAALGWADSDVRVPTFTVSGDTPLATGEDNVSVEQAFEMEDPDVIFDQNDIAPAPNQTISGRTNLAPGTELQISIESAGSPATEAVFVDHVTATVEPDGTWAGEANFSEGIDGEEYSVEVVEPTRLAGQGYTATIGIPTASVSIDSATPDRVTIATATLEEGGFLVVKSGSPTGSFAGVSGYLEPGKWSSVEVPITGVIDGETVYVVVHTDENGNEEYDGDEAYKSADGTIVSDSVTAQATDPVQQYRQLRDPTDELQPSEVMQAKSDYVVGDISLESVVTVMRAYFFG